MIAGLSHAGAPPFHKRAPTRGPALSNRIRIVTEADEAPRSHTTRSHRTMTTYARPDFNNAAITRRVSSDDHRRSTVQLQTTHGLITRPVSHGPLAVDDAVIDMARRRAGVEPAAFVTGEVVA